MPRLRETPKKYNMAYDENKKLFAYTLFMQSLNPEEIAEKIKQTYKLTKFSANTIRRWALEQNRDGLTWYDHRSRVLQIARTRVEKSSATKLSEIQSKTDTLIETIYTMLMEKLESKKIDFSSLDGGLYALKTFLDFSMKLEDRQSGAMSPLLIVQTLLQIFQSIPEVNAAIRKHWDEITREIQNRMPVQPKPVQSEKEIEIN